MKPTAQNLNSLPPHLPPQRHRAALHMATTLSALLNLPSVWPSLKSASPSSKHKPLQRLAQLSERHPDLAPLLTREMALRARRFMNGVTLYRHHPISRPPENSLVVWRSGTTVLRDFAPHLAHDPVVLVVPSLVNRFTILDLQRDHSFLYMLAAHRLRPLVVDWNEPGQDEKDFTLGDYVTKRLIPALKHVSVSAGPVHVMGYCMGGLLALAAAQLVPDRIRTLSLLATPWDFHAGYEAAGQDGALLEQKLALWLKGEEFLPVDIIQSVFTSFQPMHALRKFSGFAACDQSSADAARFVLTEDWLNDGVPLAIPAARECFGDLSARNMTAKGKWTVNGARIDPHAIQAPSYVVVPGRDRIVPPESAMPLARALPHAMRHEPMMGHIGIMASPTAPHQVWKPLAGWLAAH